MARVTHQGDPPQALPCRSCGVMDKPALSLGIGPHAIRATCALWKVSALDQCQGPRRAHDPPRQAQLPPSRSAHLPTCNSRICAAWSDTKGTPATMAERAGIDRLLEEKKGA